MTNQIPTPDFESYPMQPPVTSAAVDDGTVQVGWGDGHSSRFHFMWLRDNCAAPECIDAGSKERTYSLLDIPANVHPVSVGASEQGGLLVDWSDGHHSHFHPGWLRHFDYASGQRPIEGWTVHTWNNSLQANMPIFNAEAVLENEAVRYDFLTSIRDRGIALVTDMPKDWETFERLANQVGLLRDMNWGKIFEIVAKPDGEYIANRGIALDAHSDGATREYMPGLQIFQCVENTSAGGASFWVDGFHLANLLREHHPDAWQTLTTVKWEHANRSKGTHYRWNAPIFDLDRNGNVHAVRDTTWLREPLCVDFEQVPQLYDAYRIYVSLKADPANQVERKLVEGDVAFINNRRVLHGRREFKPETGLRHIRTCYGELEELLSSIRMIERARREREFVAVVA